MTPSIPSIGRTAETDSDLVDVREVFWTLDYYKWSILGITILAAILAALYGLMQDKYYTASTSLLIESKLVRPVPVADVNAEVPDSANFDQYYGSQYEILRSRDLIAKAVDKLKLADAPEFVEKFGRQDPFWAKWLPWMSSTDAPAGSEEQQRALRRDKVIDAIMGDRPTDVSKKGTGLLTVVPMRGTQVVRIEYKARDPKLAADVANTLADLYIDSTLQARLDTTKKTSAWLTEKLSDIRAQLEESEKRLQEYREQKQLINVGGTRTLGEDELLDVTKRLRDAQRKKTELASAYARIHHAGNDAAQLAEIPTLLNDPRVTAASQSLLEAEAALKQLRERYGEKHPSMAVVKARYDGARNAYYEALRVAAQGIKSDYEIASENERALGDVVATSREAIQKLDRQQYEATQLERDAQTNRQLYDMFLTRFKETDSTDNFNNVSARVVDAAVVPRSPSEPKILRIVVIGTAIGFALGILLAVLRHLLSEEIRSAEDLEAVTGAPVLGVTPKVSKEEARGLSTLLINKPQAPFSEGIRSVRIAIQLTDVDKKYRKLLVTSSVPKEGKTSVATALSVAFAASGQVLLIDGDLRKPSLASNLGLPPGRPGIAELLANQAKLEECLHLHEPSGVYVLPAGRHVPNPAEVLASMAFGHLVDQLAKRFNTLVFDSPPCQVAADALLLSHHVDGVLFVVHSGSTLRREVHNSYKMLRNVDAHILGNIANQLDLKSSRGGAYSGYYAYGYYGN